MQPDDNGEDAGVLARLAELDADELDALVELAQQRANGSISRRGMLQAGAAIGGGALLGGGAVGSASAQASTSDSDPNVGSPSTPVDVFAESVDANTIGSSSNRVSEIYGDSGDFNSVSTGSATLGKTAAATGSPDSRPLISNSDKTVTVDPGGGRDYSSIQTAVNNELPIFVRHDIRFDINPDDNSLDYNEDVIIPSFWTADINDPTASEAANDSVEFIGTTGTLSKTKIDSITAVGCYGSQTPKFDGINIVNQSPYSDDGFGMIFYQCRHAQINRVSFANAEFDTPAGKGIGLYNSTATISGVQLGTDQLNYGVATKHNGQALVMNDGIVSGTVNDYVARVRGGYIQLDVNGATGGSGNMQAFEGFGIDNTDDADIPVGLSGTLTGTTSLVEPNFGDWQPDRNRSLRVDIQTKVETNGASAGQITVEIDESGGTAADYDFTINQVHKGNNAGTQNIATHPLYVPPGATYRIVNTSDPNSANSIQEVRELLT